MKIDLKNITVRELVDGHVDKAEEGVRGAASQTPTQFAPLTDLPLSLRSK
ncbi:MAG: hypothetical protein UZ18_ATM001000101, partial [Armatimonadetes bacterium OLB18]